MKEVFLVPAEARLKAEEALKKDDVVSRGSIILRAASSLEIKEDGYFIVVESSEEGIKKATELLKGLATRYAKKDVVLKKIEEQDDAALAGFGSILG